MDVIGFKYQPEFIIRVRIDGEDAGDQVQLMPSPLTIDTINNSGLIIKSTPGILTAHLRQNFDGTNWVPAVDLTEPRTFSFWAIIKTGGNFKSIHFLNANNQVFGRKIFYTNNLSDSGIIDSNLSGNVVLLTSTSYNEHGSLSSYLMSADITPGVFTQFKAGKLEAGGPVTFSISEIIDSSQTNVELDLRSLSKGAYTLKLEGTAPVAEHVVFDQEAVLSEVNGIIDIYRDAWLLSSPPREYRIDFTTS